MKSRPKSPKNMAVIIWEAQIDALGDTKKKTIEIEPPIHNGELGS